MVGITHPNRSDDVAHTIDLSAEPRSVTGKKVRHLRAQGKVPAKGTRGAAVLLDSPYDGLGNTICLSRRRAQ